MPGLVDTPQTVTGLDAVQQNGANGHGQCNPAFELNDTEAGAIDSKTIDGNHKLGNGKDVPGESGGGGGGGGHGIDSDHPTSYLETTMHIFKGNVGPGLYAMGQAFYNGGIVAAPILTVLLGITCVHSQHLLLNCAAKMKSKLPNAQQLPDFAETVELCFEHGPQKTRRLARAMRLAVNVFICITQLGFCTVYFGFISNNLKQIYDHYGVHLDIRVHMAIILVPILLPTLIRNLKYLAWCMTLANICMMLGICITASYAVQDLPSISERNYFSSFRQLPLYFGTAIFAFEGIALVLPLHNAMRKPTDFGRPLGVLNVGMTIVTLIFTTLGFLGYLKWGDDVKSSLTLNLPPGDILAQSVKVMVSLGILLGYALQFFVAIQIMLPWVHEKIRYSKSHPVRVELVFRVLMVLVTFLVAESILNVGALISLIGALCSTALALVFPPVLELILGLADENGPGIRWFVWLKNAIILVLAIFIFLTGTIESLNEI